MKNEMLRHLKALWIYIVGVIVFTIFTIVGLSLLSGDMSVFDLLYGALVVIFFIISDVSKFLTFL